MRDWLTPRQAPQGDPQDERQALMTELVGLGYFVPGAEGLELTHLRDLTQAARHWTRTRAEAEAKRGAEAVARMSPDQVARVLKDFVAQRRLERNRRHV